MGARRLGRTHGSQGGILGFGHGAHGIARVREGCGLHLGQAIDESRTLFESERVRIDPAQGRQRHVRDRGQTQFDPERVLTHDVQIAFAKHVVDLVHAASDRVFDGQEGQVDLARGELFDDLGERRQPDEVPGEPAAGDVLLGGELIVGERLALVGHRDVTSFGVDQRGDLTADRVVDDLGEDLACERSRDAEGIGQGLDPRQDFALAPGIADLRRVFGLGLGDKSHGFEPAREKADDLVVGLVELLAKIGNRFGRRVSAHEEPSS